ncbi:MAG: flagellar protein FliT [Alphaproteobacteria bacterium]|nr:MAG: flagellar protein FliT [Alphaproteobacteria bacterium]
MRDVRPIGSEHWPIRDDVDLKDLFDLVCDPDRTLPVFVLTQPDERRLGMSVRDYLLDHEYLAKRMLGLGVVVTLPRDLNWTWTDMVGKTWSTFLGAVRTYRPGLDFEQDSPGNHPLALPERILAFQRGEKKAEDAFTEFLIEQAHEYAATKPVRWEPCLLYADALQRVVEVSRSRAGEDADWKSLYEQEIEALTKRIEEAEGLAQSYAEDNDQLRAALEQVEAENQSIRAYADALRIELGRKGDDSPDAHVPIPESYDEMPGWIEKHLPGRVMLHPRAIRSLKRAAYEDVGLVFRAVLALGTEYRDMRCGLDGAKDKWEAKLAELGVQFGKSISLERAGEEGETYFVKYPMGSSGTKFLEYHLRKGSTKDDRVCLGIYFFWDEDRQRVVIGSLPAHLQNRMT